MIRRTRAALVRLRDEDGGVTLVELLVYLLVLVIVVAAIGSLLISGLTGQRDITAAGNAASESSVVAESLTSSVRTAAQIGSPATVAGVGEMFQTATATFPTVSTVSWSCRAWLVTIDGRILTRVTTPAAVVPAPAGLDAAGLAGWTLLASGVSPAPGASSVFAVTSTRVRITASIAGPADGTPTIVDLSVSRDALPSFATLGANPCV